jgi:hypothetical protein
VAIALTYIRDGEPTEIGVLPRGGEVRVAFGRPDRHAAVWKVRATGKGEVYVLERSTGNKVKVSLHQRGGWRFHWNTEGDRTIDVWERPAAIQDTLTIGFSIWTSGADVVPSDPNAVPEDKVIWVEAPGDDEMGHFTVAFVRPNGTRINLKNYVPVAAFAMDSNEVALVLVTKRPMRPDEVEQLGQRREMVARARRELEDRADGPLPTTLRAMAPGRNDNGDRYILDLSMYPGAG